jgi:predicted RNA binding protein YcfA (HicA-like mRNA interferase family)
MRLRLVPYSTLARVAAAAGFQWVRCVGTHNTFRNPQGRSVTIPDHGAQVIVRPLLRRIVRDMGLTVEEYNRLLDEV